MALRSGHGTGAGVPRIEVLPAGDSAGESTSPMQAAARSRRGVRHAPLPERFWRYVNQSSGCWTWTGCTNSAGYGIIGSGGRRGQMLRAHRVSWELHFCPIPVGLFVCHACDNPVCVRPDHLLLGTVTANNEDCVRKARHRYATHPESACIGERNGRHKLTDALVRELRDRRAAGESLRQLARAFGVSKPSVQAIVRREHWRHV